MEYSVVRGGHRDLRRIYPMMAFDFEDWELPDEIALQAALLCGAELLLLKDKNGYEAGYAFMLRDMSAKRAMIFLLGVYPTLRDQGAGTAFLAKIREYYAGWNGIMLEVTEYPKSKKAKKLVAFYEKNGYAIVPCSRYRIMGRDCAFLWQPIEPGAVLSGAVADAARAAYSSLYPGDKFDKHIEAAN